MIVTFTKKEIKKKAQNRPADYVDSLKKAALSINGDGSMTFDTESVSWKALQNRHRLHLKYSVQESIQKTKAETSALRQANPTPPPKKGGCGCRKH